MQTKFLELSEPWQWAILLGSFGQIAAFIGLRGFAAITASDDFVTETNLVCLLFFLSSGWIIVMAGFKQIWRRHIGPGKLGPLPIWRQIGHRTFWGQIFHFLAYWALAYWASADWPPAD